MRISERRHENEREEREERNEGSNIAIRKIRATMYIFRRGGQ